MRPTRTIDEIASEAASRLVAVDNRQSNQEFNVAIGGKVLPQYHHEERLAASHARETVGILRSAIAEALREACSPPEPSPIEAAWLEGILARAEEFRRVATRNALVKGLSMCDDITVADVADAVNDREGLAEHVRHLERLVAFLMADEPGAVVREAYARGFADGQASVNTAGAG